MRPTARLQGGNEPKRLQKANPHTVKAYTARGFRSVGVDEAPERGAERTSLYTAKRARRSAFHAYTMRGLCRK